MKFIFPVVLFVLGSLLITFGALCKIMHWPGAIMGLLAGGALTIGGLALLAVRLLKSDKKISQ